MKTYSRDGCAKRCYKRREALAVLEFKRIDECPRSVPAVY